MTKPASGGYYNIRVKGILGEHWSEWFEGLAVNSEGSDTIISGFLPDQAALHGVLHKIRDLDLFLIRAVCLDAADAQPAQHTASGLPAPDEPDSARKETDDSS
jgi:hypothetical protein